MAQTLLERIVNERVGQSVVGTVSLAVDRLADEIAREALSDQTFRRMIRELVRRRSQEILDRLLRDGRRKRRRSTGPKRSRRARPVN